jgi:hypothetical protein
MLRIKAPRRFSHSTVVYKFFLILCDVDTVYTFDSHSFDQYDFSCVYFE